MRFDLECIRERFELDGFVYLESFFTEQEVQDVEDHLESFKTQTLATLPREQVFYEEERSFVAQADSASGGVRRVVSRAIPQRPLF